MKRRGSRQLAQRTVADFLTGSNRDAERLERQAHPLMLQARDDADVRVRLIAVLREGAHYVYELDRERGAVLLDDGSEAKRDPRRPPSWVRGRGNVSEDDIAVAQIAFELDGPEGWSRPQEIANDPNLIYQFLRHDPGGRTRLDGVGLVDSVGESSMIWDATRTELREDAVADVWLKELRAERYGDAIAAISP